MNADTLHAGREMVVGANRSRATRPALERSEHLAQRPRARLVHMAANQKLGRLHIQRLVAAHAFYDRRRFLFPLDLDAFEEFFFASCFSASSAFATSIPISARRFINSLNRLKFAI
jgi:hypothetical protein